MKPQNHDYSLEPVNLHSSTKIKTFRNTVFNPYLQDREKLIKFPKGAKFATQNSKLSTLFIPGFLENERQ